MTPSAVLEQDRARELSDTDWQHKHALEDGASTAEPIGMIEHNCRLAIRDLVRLYSFEEARFLVAEFLNDEADRRPS